MRRFLAPVLAALSLAAVPVLALADSPATMDDCAKQCNCPTHAVTQPTAKPAPTQQDGEFLNSIWTHP
jgi:hypothetical protein